MVATLLQVGFGVEYYVIIYCGRFIQGIAGAIPQLIYGKCINETIPNHLLAKYSVWNNGFTWFGLVAAGWVSLLLPSPEAHQDEFKKDNYWKVVYGFKLIPQICGIIFTLIYLKNPSLNLLIKE